MLESFAVLVRILTMREKTLGERVRAIRKQKQWSMHQLAERIGTTHSYISQLERGQIRPGIDLVMRLAEAFGVSIDHLVGRVEREGSAPDAKRLSEESAAYTVGDGETTTAPASPPVHPVIADIQEDLLQIARYDPAALEYVASIVRAIREKAARDHREQQRTGSTEAEGTQGPAEPQSES